MAKAGFYRKALEGSPDNVACYMCSCTLDGWQPGDSPWEEHTRHSRMCSLVRLDLQASREMTFEIGKWRHRGVPGIGTAQMASAGFFFCPRDAADDTAVCFQCGLALDGWEPSDNPRYKMAFYGLGRSTQSEGPTVPFWSTDSCARRPHFRFYLRERR